MAKISILPDTLISQIAAGEVVERPASVVKELVENSLDAGATECQIEIEQGGMKLIAVRDNGYGMDPQDAKLAFSRHATSKIATLEDLSNIKSFGFRGEALAAIASVAMVTMRTRATHRELRTDVLVRQYAPEITDNAGWEVSFRGGAFEADGPAGCAPGTEIIVKNLFFNTPARRKFLKSETTELSHTVATISHIAIANPTVGFELKHNGKTLLQVASGSNASERIQAVLGRDFLEEALAVSFKTPSIHIYGFIGKPGMTLSSKRHQYLFVNGRDVSDPLVSRAICDAYGSRLPGRIYPIFVLHIDLDSSEVDVNVHPRKLAVKFLDTQRIYRDVCQAVQQGLDGHVISSEADGTVGRIEKSLHSPAKGGVGLDDKTVQSALAFTKEFVQEKQLAGLEETPSQILGQIANSYILVLDEEGLSIIDQHAAHERILYEKFKNRAEEKNTQIQPLLTPLTLEISRQEMLFLKEAIPYLEKMGFEFEQWSGNTFVISACPLELKAENLSVIFRNFLDTAMSEEKTMTQKILPEKILKSLACKAAVKFGMPLSQPEQKELLQELAKTPNNSTCPHGRPTKIILTFDELERKFYRRK